MKLEIKSRDDLERSKKSYVPKGAPKVRKQINKSMNLRHKFLNWWNKLIVGFIWV